jgi:hypothetical protein
MTADSTLHETSLAVWDIPPAVAAGERFAVKVGAKSSAGCALCGRAVEVLDESGAVLASGRLGDAPWPGTAALFWTDVELRAPPALGLATLAARFDAAELDPPHQGARSPFSVAIVGRPEHTLTVTVAANGAPLEQAHVCLGPLRAMTDAAGRAEVKLAKGQYQLSIYKAGFDAKAVPLVIDADAAVAIEAQAQPEDDPDAIWTA